MTVVVILLILFYLATLEVRVRVLETMLDELTSVDVSTEVELLVQHIKNEVKEQEDVKPTKRHNRR